MSEFKDWFNSIPFFTRYWLACTIGLSLIGRFGLVNYSYFILDYYPIIRQFQVSFFQTFDVHGTFVLFILDSDVLTHFLSVKQ